MADARRPPTGRAGFRFFGRARPALEPLPVAGPVGVDPNLWAHAIVADRGRGWLRLTVGEVVRAHPKATLSAGAGAGTTILVLLGHLAGIG